MNESKPANVGDSTLRFTVEQLARVTSPAPDQRALSPVGILHAWFQLFQNARMHNLDNQALQRPIRNFSETVKGALEREGRLSFQMKDGGLFVNGARVKLSSEEYEIAQKTEEFLDERGIAGFVVSAPLDEPAVRKLVAILVGAKPGPEQFAAIEMALQREALPFQVNRTLGVGGGDPVSGAALERRTYTFFTYSKLVVLYRTLIAHEKLSPGRFRYLAKKIGRTVQALVDICMEDDHTFLGVAAVKSGESYAPHHAANTAVLSIALGHALGLSKIDLADLGMAAVFHDVGLRRVPASLLDKKAALDEQERAVVAQHPIRGVEFLLTDQAFTRTLLSQIVVTFEHSRRGPRHANPRRAPHLFSRIVALVSCYDALTTDRPWRRAFLPDEALGHLLRDEKREFDPVLVKVLVNALGLYPAGTLVRLSSGELAVVLYGGAGDGARAAHPVVALLAPDGRPAKSIDLLERDATGRHACEIVASEDPAKYGLNVASLLAQGAS